MKHTRQTGRGKFITFEGGEGTGKSTQVARLTSRLNACGMRVHQTREPGGCEEAEAVRKLLVSGDPDRWLPMSEALLVSAARFEHLARVVRPMLQSGAWVVCDRFYDSTMAYQGLAGGLGATAVETLSKLVVGETTPDLTLIFDLPLDVSMKRAMGRDSNETRFEKKGLAFHEHLRTAFLKIAEDHPERCALVDATGTPDEVEARVLAVLETRLGLESGEGMEKASYDA